MDEAAFAKLVRAAPLRRRRLPRPGDVRSNSARRSAESNGRCTTWPSRRACSPPSPRAWPSPAVRTDARVVVEKPFGRDLASAQELNRTLHQHFPEPAIFRIDHYLGKEPVLNLLFFRFANTVPRAGLEPQLRPTACRSPWPRSFGVAGPRQVLRRGRGDPRRDPEPHAAGRRAAWPWSRRAAARPTASATRRCKVLKAIRPLDPPNLVRGQFRGYREEAGVAADSQVETFAAVRLFIDSWRWGGVPFFIRAGKCLPVTCTEVLRRVPPPAAAGVRRPRGAARSQPRPPPLQPRRGDGDGRGQAAGRAMRGRTSS